MARDFAGAAGAEIKPEWLGLSRASGLRPGRTAEAVVSTQDRPLAFSILPHHPIYRYRDILMELDIPELHHLMPLPRQLSPPARLLAILLNRLEHSTIHLELNHSQPSASYSPHRNLLIVQQHFFAIHQLRGN